MKPRHFFGRIALFTGLALFSVLWPMNYGITDHRWWVRLLAVIPLLIRALFIGYGAAMLLFRPWLTVRKSGDPELVSLTKALGMLRGELRSNAR